MASCSSLPPAFSDHRAPDAAEEVDHALRRSGIEIQGYEALTMIGGARMSLEAAAEMAQSVETEAIYAENQRTRKIARLTVMRFTRAAPCESSR